MKMILSLIQPDAGEVQLLGEKVTSHSYEIFKKVGSIIEKDVYKRQALTLTAVNLWKKRLPFY